MELMTEEKKEFKKTELGEFPEDWIFKPISESTNYVDYRGATPKKVDHGVTLVTAKNIKKGYIDYSESKEYVEPENYDEIMSRGKPEIGDILITTEAPLGHVAAVDNTNIALAQRVIKYRAIESFLDNDYLKYFFLSDRFQENLYTNSSGSTATGIKGSVLHKLPICFPPTLEEQNAIASALSDVDELIRSLDRLIEKKEAIKKGTMQQLLTGKKRLSVFDGEWEVKMLGDVLSVQHGKSQKQVESKDGDYPILATGGQIGKAKDYLYNKPSVLIGRKGTIDKPQYVDEPFWTIDTLFYTEVKKNAIPKFLYYKFLLIDWRSYNEASGVPSLNSSTIESIEVIIPDDLTEQKAIVNILDDMDRELQTLRQKREKYKQIKQGMMQELLTGRTRLITD